MITEFCLTISLEMNSSTICSKTTKINTITKINDLATTIKNELTHTCTMLHYLVDQKSFHVFHNSEKASKFKLSNVQWVCGNLFLFLN